MVIHRSCSSFLVSVNLVSPAFAPAMIPALETRESVKVDFPEKFYSKKCSFLAFLIFFYSIANNAPKSLEIYYKTKKFLLIKKLTVIDVGNNGHVPDIFLPVHERPNFIYSKVDLENKDFKLNYNYSNKFWVS